jgi:hypothetical protein
MPTPSIVHSRLRPTQVKPLTLGAQDVEQFRALERIGIGFDPNYLRRSTDRFAAMDAAMDANWAAAPVQVTTPSIVTPIQFLQNWLPGFVKVITAARKIDEFLGIDTVGNWRDEWIIQGVLEPEGNVAVYEDSTNIPLADWNVNWEQRTIVRMEMGIVVGRLEQARASAAMVNSDAEKRAAAMLQLEIWRNLIGFYGFNGGANNTYGFLNDPSLPAYVTLPNGAAGSSTWSSKTYLEITQDIIAAMNAIQTQSQDNIDPEKVDTTLALPMSVYQQLAKTTDYPGVSVRKWLKDTYPKCRVVSAPQLDTANGSDNVFYLWADEVEDGGTDDKRSIIQVVPVKFMALGVEQRAKSYIEDFTNATAGVMVKRPYAIYRASGC